jgi:crotonobetainyl-CoA:carnitine CoA-transferase CaiB-like acyl-CoA transferase
MGPVATQILGDMGAEVLKIEPPQGDPIRLLGPSRDPGMDYSNCFGADSRNCRSESAIMSIGADLSAS